MRKLVDVEFRAHTVVSIAHRLDTIMGYDKVIVLDEGSVVEVGNPRELLLTAGRFRALWNASHSETVRN